MDFVFLLYDIQLNLAAYFFYVGSKASNISCLTRSLLAIRCVRLGAVRLCPSVLTNLTTVCVIAIISRRTGPKRVVRQQASSRELSRS